MIPEIRYTNSDSLNKVIEIFKVKKKEHILLNSVMVIEYMKNHYYKKNES